MSMLLIPFVVLPAANLGKRIRISSRSSQDKMAEMNNVLQETFSGIRIVKGFVMEAFEVEKFRAATRRLLKINLRWVRAHALTSPLMEFLGAITIAMLLLYARNAIIRQSLTTGAFVAFLYALIKMYEPIKRLTGVNNSFQQAVGASEQVFAYLDIHSEVKEKPGAADLPPFHDEIVPKRQSPHR
jgi:subfamily B ATP-binding cassette protein MsbA